MRDNRMLELLEMEVGVYKCVWSYHCGSGMFLGRMRD